MSNPTPLRYTALCSHFPTLPRTALIESAFDYARENMPDYLFNHVTRSFICSTRVAEKNSIKYDAEVVAVSTLINDIGLTSKGEGPNRFEVNGAIVAADFVRKLGFDDRRTQHVWDSIAIHATSSISLLKETEVALRARGIGVTLGRKTLGRFPSRRSTTSLPQCRVTIWSSGSRLVAAAWRKHARKRPATTSCAISERGLFQATKCRPWWIESLPALFPNNQNWPI